MAIQRTVLFYKFAHVSERLLLFDRDLQTVLSDRLRPGAEVHRYGRRWLLAKPRNEPPYLFGKLGYVQAHQQLRLVYDTRLQDFVSERQSGEDVQFSHFVIRLNESLIAFEIKPPRIEKGSFIGALRQFVEGPNEPYELIPVSDPKSFAQWRRGVDRVEQLTVVAVPPNPSTSARARELKEALRAMNATKLRLEVTSGAAGGLNTNQSLLRAGIHHAAEGYGKVRARGRRGDEEQVYETGSEVRTAQISESDDDTSEDIYAKITHKIEVVVGRRRRTR